MLKLEFKKGYDIIKVSLVFNFLVILLLTGAEVAEKKHVLRQWISNNEE
jgi:hypothetical protein